MPKALSILITAAIVLQSLLGGVAAAGTICLGGGHEHPPQADAASCELDCSHASGRTPLSIAVAEAHGDCQCVDLDWSVVELLTTPPRDEASVDSHVLLLPVEQALPSLAPWGERPGLSPVPSWFDPSGAQRAAVLCTSRLNL